MKNFDEWNDHKKIIENKSYPWFVYEREVWWCSLGINIRQEEDGKNDLFERPVLVLKSISPSLVLVVPFTSKNNHRPYHYSFYESNIKYTVIFSQVRILSTKRLLRKIRKLDKNLFERIKQRMVRALF